MAQAAPLEEIVVTATRRANSIQDIPINITAIGGNDIAEQRLYGLNEISYLVPGLQIIDRGPRDDVTDIVARGLNTSSLGPGFSSTTVGTYVGEIPMPIDLKTQDLERVEVLIGPQGTLYGAGTLGGAVRYIPAKPRDEFEFSVRGTAMSLDHSDGFGSDVGFTVNAPLGDSNFAIRASVDLLDDPGYIDYPYVVRESGVSEPDPDFSDPAEVAANLRRVEDANGEDTLSGRIALRWMPSNNVDATLTYYYQDMEAEGRSLANVESFGTGRYEAAYRYEEPFDIEKDLVALEIIADLGFAELTSATGMSSYTGLGQRDQTDLLLDFEYGYELFPTFSAFTREDENNDILTQELRLVSTGTGRLNWIAGLFHYNLEEHLESREFTPGFDQFAVDNFGGVQLRPDSLEYIEVTDVDRTETALYGELSYEFAQDWEVTLGARLYEFEDKVSGGFGLPLYDTVFLGASPDATFESISFASNQTDDSGSLLKLNLSHYFRDDILGYLTISEGYRIGGLNAVPECTPEQLTSGNQELCATADEILIEADTTTNYELGVHSTLANGRLTLNAALYYIDWDDIQIDDTTVNGSLSITSNGGKARSQGAELSADWRINSNWRLGATLAFNEAELAERAGRLVDDGAGNVSVENGILGDGGTGALVTPAGARLPGSPELQGSVTLAHNRSLNNGWELNVRYAINYMGDMVNSVGAGQRFPDVEADPLWDPMFDLANWGGELIPSYTLHNLTIGVSHDQWTAAFFVDNLTDEYAITGTRTSRRFLPANRGLINGLPLRNYGYYVGRPRTAGLRFTWDF
jgi:outer membrane receptor protein involved in Fe transport